MMIVSIPIGTPIEPPSGLALPDKKTLELILDKLQKQVSHSVFSCALFVTFPYFVYVLQFWCLIIFYDRKDIYGVYAEPVDPEEVSLLVTSLDI